MRKLNFSLTKQLVIMTIMSFSVLVISLVIVLPKSLEPFFEQTVYGYLEQPLEVFEGNQNQNQAFKNIAYIQYKNDETYVSSNYMEVLKVSDYNELLKYIKVEDSHSRGKFIYKNKTYYYFVSTSNGNKKIAITTDYYFQALENNMFMIVAPLIVITFLIILLLMLLWSDILVRKIGKLKLKIDNMTDENFSISKSKLEFDDELKLLDKTVDDMKYLILSNEKYRREMYQNISHDFKTPITVVKSYAEAYHDGIKDADTVIKVSEEQMNKLEKKIKTLLDFNKITYLQNSYKNDMTIDVLPIVNTAVEKYKVINSNIDYKIKCDKKKIIYKGTDDIWESIINNLLNNAIRYAKNKIIITIKEDKMIFYNDGEPIDKKIINDIFLPYKKGKKGENGLGLSIVKGNLDLLKYKISVRNLKVGVEFVISK